MPPNELPGVSTQAHQLVSARVVGEERTDIVAHIVSRFSVQALILGDNSDRCNVISQDTVVVIGPCWVSRSSIGRSRRNQAVSERETSWGNYSQLWKME